MVDKDCPNFNYVEIDRFWDQNFNEKIISQVKSGAERTKSPGINTGNHSGSD